MIFEPPAIELIITLAVPRPVGKVRIVSAFGLRLNLEVVFRQIARGMKEEPHLAEGCYEEKQKNFDSHLIIDKNDPYKWRFSTVRLSEEEETKAGLFKLRR